MSNSFECEVHQSFMTASELIEMLAKALREYGDLQVRVFDMETEDYTAIDSTYDATDEFIILYPHVE